MPFGVFVIIMLLPTVVYANGGRAGAADAPVPCQPTWSSSVAYNTGAQASVGNINYKANWWTQGDNPALQSGIAGSGKPWAIVDNCQTSKAPAAPIAVLPPLAAPTAMPTGNTLLTVYKDVAISANWNTSVISTDVTGAPQPLMSVSGVPAVTWAFATGECGNETWGGISATSLAGANVKAWSDAKKPYVISTGGASGTFTCGTDAGFAAFLERYSSPSMLGVDFDIEAGQSQAQIAALVARVKAAQANPRYSQLRFSFTIATLGGNAPQSLGLAGIMVMDAIKQAGLSSYYVNLMAMDYGAARLSNCTVAEDGSCAMGPSAIQAAANLHQAYGVPYNQIELTAMIGGNDAQDETFTLADVDLMVAFARRQGLAAVHFWSLDRDRDCPPGFASPTCNSYGLAGTLGFSKRFVHAVSN